ncbi:MAG: hypothetical protein AAGA75_09045 [Cyanobacteria bacterium P01_E01_bin.6]
MSYQVFQSPDVYVVGQLRGDPGNRLHASILFLSEDVEQGEETLIAQDNTQLSIHLTEAHIPNSRSYGVDIPCQLLP